MQVARARTFATSAGVIRRQISPQRPVSPALNPATEGDLVTNFTDAKALELAAGRAGFESPDPMPMEVPVHVRGLVRGGLNLGADCAFEPFCEDTLTVLVSSRGAVLRLAAQTAPGQEILLSSPSLGRERIARVVRYRGHPDVKGYAEVEFTRPVPAAAQDASATTQHGVPLAGLPLTTGRDARLDSRYAAPAMPLVVTPLADLLTGAHRPASASSIALPMPPAVRGFRSEVTGARSPLPATVAGEVPLSRRVARRRAKSAAPPNAAPLLDIEKLLAARQAALCAVPSARELAARLLPGEHALFAQPLRRRTLAVVGTALLVLGVAGGWAVVGGAGTPSPGPQPQMAAFALPTPPLENASNVVLAPRILLEPEAVPLPTVLVTPARHAATTKPLAAPVVRRVATGAASADSAPALGSSPEFTAPNLDAILSGSTPAPAPLQPGVAAAAAQAPVVIPPRLVSQAPVEYPVLARQARVEGDVILDARVDETGQVVQTRVVSGALVLRQAAQDAVMKWRYEPATLNGKPIATHVYVTLQFRR